MSRWKEQQQPAEHLPHILRSPLPPSVGGHQAPLPQHPTRSMIFQLWLNHMLLNTRLANYHLTDVSSAGKDTKRKPEKWWSTSSSNVSHITLYGMTWMENWDVPQETSSTFCQMWTTPATYYSDTLEKPDASRTWVMLFSQKFMFNLHKDNMLLFQVWTGSCPSESKQDPSPLFLALLY